MLLTSKPNSVVVIDLQHQEKEIEACSEAMEIPPGFECIAVAATASMSSGPSFADTSSLKELDLLPGFDCVAGSNSHGFTCESQEIGDCSVMLFHFFQKPFLLRHQREQTLSFEQSASPKVCENPLENQISPVGSGRQARDVDRTSEGTENKACPNDMGEDSFFTSASVPISSPAGHAQLPFLAKQQTAEEAEVFLLSSKESEKLKSA